MSPKKPKNLDTAEAYIAASNAARAIGDEAEADRLLDEKDTLMREGRLKDGEMYRVPRSKLTRRDLIAIGVVAATCGLTGAAAVYTASNINNQKISDDQITLSKAKLIANNALMYLEERDENDRAEHPNDPANAYKYLVGTVIEDLKNIPRPSFQSNNKEERKNALKRQQAMIMNEMVPVLKYASERGAGYLIYSLVKQYPGFSAAPISYMNDENDKLMAFDLLETLTKTYATGQAAQPDREYPDAQNLIAQLEKLPQSNPTRVAPARF